MATDSPRKLAEKRLLALKNERSSWDVNAKEISDFILPMRSRVMSDDTNRGDRRNNKIINNRATMASRTTASGMMSGITSPARPWFNLAPVARTIMEFGPVKSWFYECTQRMRDVFLRSNLYQVLPTCYQEGATFGTGCIWVDESPDTVIRCEAFTWGEYYLANGADGRCNAIYREFKWTVNQLAEKFGRASLSPTAQSMLDAGNGDQFISCAQRVELNMNANPDRADGRSLPFSALTWEAGAPGDQVLEHRGYHEFPAMAFRWDLLPGDAYGTGPGRICLGDVKALQLYERQAARMTETGANPPLQAPAELKGQPSSTIPGGVTYVPMVGGHNQMAPIYQPNAAWLAPIQSKIKEHEARINEAFFVDLFLMVSQLDTVRTATEIAARKEEKMLMLGPVLERINDDLLDPLIDRTFNIMLRQSVPIWAGIIDGDPLLPPPPEELINANSEIQAVYVSILAQAQKSQNVLGLERFATLAGNLSGAFPEVLDKVDSDQLVEEYADAIGVVPTVVRGADQVAAIREQRARQKQAEQAQQAMGQAIQGAKLLSETEVTPDNVLGQMLGA
ncbi:portal protein [Pseudomonas sp. AE27]|uniref:portal protein n=1 Tax=Pseudomonas sp. AE27 TaxID=3127460 RepID=UPI0030CDC8DA